jgi:hypothetical protein
MALWWATIQRGAGLLAICLCLKTMPAAARKAKARNRCGMNNQQCNHASVGMLSTYSAQGNEQQLLLVRSSSRATSQFEAVSFCWMLFRAISRQRDHAICIAELGW